MPFPYRYNWLFIFSITRWSTDSGGGCVASGVTQQSEEEEGNFTVSYLAKQLEKNTGNIVDD